MLEHFTIKSYNKKTDQNNFRIEKVIKRKDDKLYVKWNGCNSSLNSWIDRKDI